jgi:hypothetical protein
MKNYYNISTFERRDIIDETMDGWINSGNPKANNWQLTPPEPEYNPETQILVWGNGEWLVENLTLPTYTAEEWVGKYFSNLEVIALMRLEQAILSQGKTLGPKMEASKQWLEAMMFAQPSSSFPAAPFSYAETSGEAAQTLANN